MVTLVETENHRAYDHALRDKKMYPVIAYGSAGTSKTYKAMGFAKEWLERSNKHQVILVRPNVSFAQTNGFLPGGEKDKLEPWIRPFRHCLKEHGLSLSHQENLESNGKIQYLMLEHIQGLTFDNSLIVVDECENMTFTQMKVLLTRIGKWSKLVMCGDIAQTSPRFSNSGLAELIGMVHELELPVHTINFTVDDILRGEQCKMFIKAFQTWEETVK